MSKKFDFNKQMQTGDVGELHFSRHYAALNPVKSVEDLRYDFTLVNGKKVELKTDTYDMSATPNFFMEYFSDSAAMKVGGPWRAKQDSVDYFVYYFLKNKTFYWFDTEPMIKALEDYIAIYKPQLKSVRNKNWITQGFAIPRDSLSDIEYCRVDTY
jgi:hypothetical protein